MTHPPSAVALEAAMILIARLQHEPVDPLDDDIVPTALALDTFAARDYARMEVKIKAMRKEAKPSDAAQRIRGALLHELDEDNEFTDLACSLLDIAAERALAAAQNPLAKPAASDPERRVAWEIVLQYLADIGVEEPSEYEDRLGDAIAAALAERGRVEREAGYADAEKALVREQNRLLTKWGYDAPTWAIEAADWLAQERDKRAAAIRNQTTNDEA